MNNNLDKIIIRDLLLRCVIGIFEHERINKQDVLINLVLYTDLSNACESDDLNDSVDYKKIKKEIINLVENSAYYLVEKLAGEISKICLKNKKVKKVDVTVDKPNALRFTKSAAIEITRYND